MSGGPWRVPDPDDEDDFWLVINDELGVSLAVHVETWLLDEEWAHRIAERLNRTEGDER